MASVYVCLFFGGGQGFFFKVVDFDFLFLDIIFYFKVIFLIFVFIFLRANLPRFRFDQLMIIG
jgi:NADH:ubiquinone oxidoreductase subunit H